MPIIKIQTNDGQTFPVDSEIIIKCSGLIREMLQWTAAAGGRDGDMGNEVKDGEEEEEEELVHLEKLDGPTWQKIYEWATFHKDDPPLKKDGGEDDEQQRHQAQAEMGTWDADFVKQELATLAKLVNAANFLDIKPLLDLLCKAVANLVKGKSPEENRQLFGIRNQ